MDIGTTKLLIEYNVNDFAPILTLFYLFVYVHNII